MCNQAILYLGQVGPVPGEFVVYSEGFQLCSNQKNLYLGRVGPVSGEFVV